MSNVLVSKGLNKGLFQKNNYDNKIIIISNDLLPTFKNHS
jgi:hypothetical protein